MHNLATVFSFEVVRTLKKRTFWIASLLFPVMFGVIAGVMYFSNKATNSATEKSANEEFSIEITDDSKLLKPALLASVHAKSVTKAKGIADAKNGRIDAYFYYPQNLETQKIEVYGRDVGMFDNNRYETVAKTLLTQSVEGEVSKNVATILGGKTMLESKTYKNHKESNPFQQMIAPGIFLVLFYILIATFGNQMLTSTTEEKENRVIEMILTMVQARTLIIGKILALIVLGFLQMVIVLVPVAIGYVLLHDKLSLPSFDISHIPLDPERIGLGFVIFAVSFMMFTGLLVAVGSAAPSAKEAGSFFGVLMMLIFGPLYAAPLFVSSPNAGIVQVLSYFPLTAPIPLLLRNAVGNLEYWQAGIALAILIVAMILVLNLAVRTFRQGALEYSRRLSFKEIFARR